MSELSAQVALFVIVLVLFAVVVIAEGKRE